MKKFRKALKGSPSCPKCSNFIPMIINGYYKCSYCGHERKTKQKENNDKCLCWLMKEMCPVHFEVKK